ncbi:Uncharacterised protein [Mycobacteroides abscessus]|nr:Uncharacterised protein [Mycobacteroides abscessus]
MNRAGRIHRSSSGNVSMSSRRLRAASRGSRTRTPKIWRPVASVRRMVSTRRSP